MDNLYEVLSPWAEVDPVPLKGIQPRVSDLANKTIGLFPYAIKVSSRPVLSVIEKKLKERFPDSKTTWFIDVDHPWTSLFDSPAGRAKFEEWIKVNKVDTVIVGRGD